MPRAIIAAVSISAARAPVSPNILSFGSRATSDAGNSVRSRIASTMSKPASRPAASFSSAGSVPKKLHVARAISADQSALRARFSANRRVPQFCSQCPHLSLFSGGVSLLVSGSASDCSGRGGGTNTAPRIR